MRKPKEGKKKVEDECQIHGWVTLFYSKMCSRFLCPDCLRDGYWNKEITADWLDQQTPAKRGKKKGGEVGC
jgi:hypothetical protein